MKPTLTLQFDSMDEMLDYLSQKNTLTCSAPSTETIEIVSSTESSTPEEVEPTQPATVEPVVTPTVSTVAEVDANGRPWDERIHSGAKSCNKDGTWKYRRGVHTSVKEQVEAELDAAKSVPADATITADAGAPVGTVVTSTPPGDQVPPPPPSTQTPPPPPADDTPPVSTDMTWPEFIGEILKAGLNDKLEEAVKKRGVETTALLANMPELYAPLLADLGVS